MTRQLAKVYSNRGVFTVVYKSEDEHYIVYRTYYGADGNKHKEIVHKCADYGSALQTVAYKAS